MKFTIVKKLDDSDSEVVSQIVKRIQNITKALKWQYVNEEKDFNFLDFIIVVGGDGTMLYGMNLSSKLGGVPVFGFNIGKVGYLAEFQPEHVEETIVKIANANYNLNNRSVISTSMTDEVAINEFAIVPALSKDTLKYEFFIDAISSGQHHANGLLISTPTGSTAYSLSVGGSIIQPDSPVFQISPIAAMSLNSRSIIVSDKSVITVRIKTRKDVNYNLVADGRIVQEVVGDGDFKEVLFTRHNKNAVLLHSLKWNFFDVLQNKLHWNTIV